mgnify:CR=1 FL=1
MIEEAIRIIRPYLPAILIWLSGAVPTGIFFWFFTDIRARRYYKVYAPRLSANKIAELKENVQRERKRAEKAERERDLLRMQIKTVKAAVRMEE